MKLTINRRTWRTIFEAFKKIKPLWLILGGIVFCLAFSVMVCWLWSQDVKAGVLYAGTVFELMGLGMVAVGLRDLRKKFDLESLPHMIREFFLKLASGFTPPKYGGTIEAASMTCTPTISTCRDTPCLYTRRFLGIPHFDT